MVQARLATAISNAAYHQAARSVTSCSLVHARAAASARVIGGPARSSLQVAKAPRHGRGHRRLFALSAAGCVSNGARNERTRVPTIGARLNDPRATVWCAEIHRLTFAR